MTRREFFLRLARAAGVSAAWKAGGAEAAESALLKIANPNGTVLQRFADWLLGW